MALIREHMDIDSDVWLSSYLTYKNKVVGISGSSDNDSDSIRQIDQWLRRERAALKAYAAAISVRLFTQKATTLSELDVLSLPYPEQLSLNISSHEQILVDDIVDYYRDLIRLGEDSKAMKQDGISALPAYAATYTRHINAVYEENRLHALEAYMWPGVVCQPFIFGQGKVDWTGADDLKERLDALLREQRGSGLTVTRVARIYDGACIYLLKPNRLRYWLRSIALRDADETLNDLWNQGF